MPVSDLHRDVGVADDDMAHVDEVPALLEVSASLQVQLASIIKHRVNQQHAEKDEDCRAGVVVHFQDQLLVLDLVYRGAIPPVATLTLMVLFDTAEVESLKFERDLVFADVVLDEQVM